jgi:hypothetical protein
MKLILVIFLYTSFAYGQGYAVLNSFHNNHGPINDSLSHLSTENVTHINFGGSARFQYQYFYNEKWGDVPRDKNGHIFLRLLGHSEIKFRQLRTLIELQSSLSKSRINPSPVDENPLDIHQAFTDIGLNTNKTVKILLRIGRQEMFYGSQRLVSVREGPNSRLAFDGARVIITNNKFSNSLFYTRPVANMPGILNDDINADSELWGSYLSFPGVTGNTGIDLYYIGLKKHLTVLDNAMGRELRHSTGIRIWRKNRPWEYDAEGVWQWGSLASQSIAAWTLSLNTSYTFKIVSYKTVFGFKTEIISGDGSKDDNKQETFNPLYPKGAYFGLAALIGPSNLYDLHPYLTFSPSKTIELSLDCDAFWRMSLNDGIYTPSLSLIYPSGESRKKFIGCLAAADIAYNPNGCCSIMIEGTCFFPGGFIQQSGRGYNLYFAAISVQFKF